MKRIMKQILAPICLFFSLPSNSQTLFYSAEESSAIHDSIDKSRWDIGGSLSKYSFRYMSEFFPTAIISKPATPYVFKVVANKSIEAIKVKSKNTTISFAEYLNKKHFSGFIIVHKGNIVYEKYPAMLPGDLHSLQSVNKVITSTLVTNLINEGKLGIDEPIEKYLTELKDSDWQGISIRNILNMRSGMDSKSIDFESGPFSNPDHKNYKLESALGILPKANTTPASVYDFVKGLRKEKDAGIAPEYSNINTFVLGWLAERITGSRYADLVSERIWKPMGASSDAYVCLSDKGIAWPHGGVSATLRDLARFGMLYTNSEIKNRKESLVSFAQIKEIFDAKPIVNPIAPFKWAYQWDLADNGLMMKGGFGGQAVFVHPEKEIVIAYFNYIDSDWSIDNNLSFAVLDDIIKATAK